jgi:hypothetical protein
MARATVAGRPSPTFRSAPSFVPAPHFGSHFGGGFSTGFRRPFRGPRRIGRRRFYAASFPLYFGSYGSAAYDWGGQPWAPDFYPAQEDYTADGARNGDALLRQQEDIDRLEDEVAHLRQARDSREAASSRPTEIASSPTLLIFRDKHTQEVQNYAVVGGTLWIFTEQRASKIPLSWLDIEATTQANDERGVDFRLPN